MTLNPLEQIHEIIESVVEDEEIELDESETIVDSIYDLYEN